MFSWVADNWKSIVTVGASILVGLVVTAVIIATAPVSLPALLVTTVAVAAGGFAGGVTGYYLRKWFADEEPSLTEALREGTISAVVSVATLGLGRAFAPAIARVVAPAITQVAPETAAPFATRVVSESVSYATAGATTGAGAQVLNNALDDRPLDEGVVDAAKQGAILGVTFTVASETAPLIFRAPASEVLTPTRPVDPVTQTVLDKYGLTRESYVWRVTEPQWVQDGSINGNPRSMATVRNPYELVESPLNGLAPELELPKVPKRMRAAELGPSLNVAVEDPAIYSSPGMVKVAIKVGDLIDRGAKFYPDDGAVVTGIKPLIVTFDGPVPVKVVPLTATTSDSTVLAPPSETRGIIDKVGDVSR